MDRIAPTENHAYIHNGQKIYEWNQTVNEVNILIELPTGVRAKQLDIKILPNHLTVGIVNLPPYLDKDLAASIIVSDSLWTVEDGILALELVKAQNGLTWAAAIAGHELEAAHQADDQRRLMLERFQAEHPGFDFSQADFNGQVPDPATFLKDL